MCIVNAGRWHLTGTGCIYQSPHGAGLELLHKTLKLLSQDVSVNYNPVVLQHSCAVRVKSMCSYEYDEVVT